MAHEIPRTIWALWLQGHRNAPGIVQSCLESWEKLNPAWDLVVIDEATLPNYADIDTIIGPNEPYVTMQAKADILRLNLLAKYGGIWVDATCLCLKPLDDWLEDRTRSGFFAFERPGIDRPIANWFLASSPACYLTNAYCEAANRYWRENVFAGPSNPISAALVWALLRLSRRDDWLPRLWFTPLVTEGLRAYPYFWPHYLFADLIARDEKARMIWSRTPRVSADGPHRLQYQGLLKPVSEKVRRAIDERRDPLYKLTWKFPREEYTAGCTLDYVLQSVGVARSL